LCKKILNTGSAGGDKNTMYKKRNYAFLKKKKLFMGRIMPQALDVTHFEFILNGFESH